MTKRDLTLCTSFGLALLSSPAYAGERCDTAVAALRDIGPALVCVESSLGVGLAPDEARAGQLARLGQAAEDRFKRHLGRAPARYAIIEITDRERIDAQKRALNAAGFQRIQAWFSRASYVEMVQASLRTSAEAAARRAGMDDAAVRSVGDAAVAQQAGLTTTYALEGNEASVVPHEIGHGLYVEAFWPGLGLEARGHYGGPGPDWLDEVAPLLVEGADFAEARRSQFRDVYRGEGRGILAGHPVGDLVDLSRFLARDHPVKMENGSQALQDTARAGGLNVTVLRSGDAQGQVASLREASVFYLQGRVFADFLIDRTGDPAVFGSIAEAFGRNETFDQWLEANGSTKGLPSDVAALDRQWRSWLEARFGPSGGPGQTG